MGVTIKELAKEAGVSVPTVSRLINGDKTLRISKETYKQIMTVKDRLGGVKRRVPIRRTLTHNIAAPASQVFEANWMRTGLAKPPHPFNPEKYLADNIFLMNFKNYLESNKFLLSYNFFDPASQFSFFQNLVKPSLYCDGLLLLTGIVDEALVGLLAEYQFPHVSADLKAERLEVTTVCQNEFDGVCQIIRHLMTLGHRRIGYLGPQAYRYPFFLAATAEESLEDGIFLYFTPVFDGLKGQEDWYHIGYEAFCRYLGEPNPQITAFVCHNDWMALGAVQAMKERGLVPGRDLSLVGYDDLEPEFPERFASPILTTIATPWDRIGRRCGELLLNQILHKQMQIVHERLPVRLVVRQTTGPCRKS